MAKDKPKTTKKHLFERHRQRFIIPNSVSTEQLLKILRNQESNSKPAFLKEKNKAPNHKTPAAYTYFGQFIGHDLSFDIKAFQNIKKEKSKPTNPIIDQSHDSERQYRTPSLDLDSVYGRGPIFDYQYYDQRIFEGRVLFFLPSLSLDLKIIHDNLFRDKSPKNSSAKRYFKIEDFYLIATRGNNQIIDLPRVGQSDLGIPLIADRRNDENLIISQLHLSFLFFHNSIAIQKLLEEKSNTSFIKYIKTLYEIDLIRKKYHIKEHINEFNNELCGFISSSLSHGEGQNENIFTEATQNYLKSFLEGDSINFEALEIIEKAIVSQEREPLLRFFDRIFEDTKEEVILHYQWCLLYDYLPKIVGNQRASIRLTPETINSLGGSPAVYQEFSKAAFRFGHSMVRLEYTFSTLNKGSRISNLFETKKRNRSITDLYVDWQLFTSFAATNMSGQIGPMLEPNMLFNVPTLYSLSKNIVFRNLNAGFNSQLTYGQKAAETMGFKVINFDYIRKNKKEYISYLERIANSLPDFEHNNACISKDEILKSLCDKSPLWFYILLEAMIEENGEQLGDLGSYILLQTILSVLKNQKEVNLLEKVQSNPDWSPKYFIGDFSSKLNNNEWNGDDSLIAIFKAAGVYQGAIYTPKTKKKHKNLTPPKPSPPPSDTSGQ
jgi:hypothetical protein